MRDLLRILSPRLGLGAAVLTALVACSDPTDPIPMNLADQLWEVRIDPKAITMSTVAPYDTITLRTIAINGFGDTITDGLEIQYEPVSDTSMRISDDGVLHVRTPTSLQGTKLVAHVTYKNVTRTDTALVVVTTNAAPPHPLDSIILEPLDMWTGEIAAPILSVTPAFTGNFALVHRAFGNGLEVANVPISYVSSDESVVLVDPWTGALTPKLAGKAHIIATTTWYGKPYQTILDIQVIGPMYGEFHIQERIPRGSDTAVFVVSPGSIEVEPGAVVRWTNKTSRPVEIVFDDPASARELTGAVAQTLEFLCLLVGRWCHVGKTSGNFSLPALNPSDPNDDQGMNMRAFPDTGTYHFQIASGVRGTIIVKSSLPTP
jgi:plastocyanin